MAMGERPKAEGVTPPLGDQPWSTPDRSVAHRRGPFAMVAGACLPADDRRVYEESLSSARAGLGERDFAAARAEGQAMTLEQAVTYALEEDGS